MSILTKLSFPRSQDRLSGWSVLFGAWLVFLAAWAGLLIPFYLGLMVGGKILFYLSPAWLISALGILLVALAWSFLRRSLRWLFSPLALRFYLYSTLVLASLVVLFYSIERWRGHRAWAAVQNELRQSGENLDPASSAPAGLTSQNNFYTAPAVTNLLALISSHRNPRKYSTTEDSDPAWLLDRNIPHPDQLIAWTRQKPVDLKGIVQAWRTQKGASLSETSSAAAIVLQRLNAHGELLNQVREAAARPYAWPYAFPPRFNHDTTSYQILQRAFLLRACAALAEGQTAESQEDILATFRLAGHAWQLPYPRIVEYLSLVQPIWEGCAAHRWTSAQLTVLENTLSQVDILAHHPFVLRKFLFFDMALINQVFPVMESLSTAERVFGMGEAEGGWPVQLLRWIYPRGWIYQDQSAIFRVYQEHKNDLVHAKDAGGLAGYHVSPELPTLDPFFAVFIAPRVFESCQLSFSGSVIAQAALDLARIGCALEHFRLVQGRWPDQLDDLKPNYLREIPKDLLSGTPFRYRVEPSGRLVLYSAGWNGQDDGGMAGSPTVDNYNLSVENLKDLVWSCR